MNSSSSSSSGSSSSSSNSGGRRARVMASSLSLPQNTITDILSRLPVKSLTRFKSVSKHWATLTSNPAFIAAHLRRSSLRPSLLIRQYNLQFALEFAFFLINNPTRKSPRSHHLILDLPLDRFLLRFPKIVGSDHGLVCLDISPCFASDFIFWNPSTKQFKRLPPPLITPSKTNPFWLVFNGFGFDSFNKDYKLVRIVAFKTNDPLPPPLRVEVYSWKEGVWREIEERFDSTMLYGASPGVVVGDSLNWVAIGTDDSNDDTRYVVSFDMGREVFKRIELPEVAGYGNVKVMPYMGLLAIAAYPWLFTGNGVNMNSFEFWVYGDGEDGLKHWNRKMFIEHFSKSLVPIGTWRDRELVIKNMGIKDGDHSPSLMLYDLANDMSERLPIDGSDVCYEMWSYVESLVPLNGGGGGS